MRNKIIVLFVLVAILFACKHQVISPGDSTSTGNGNGSGSGGSDSSSLVCFEGEVLPIFISNCAKSGCHDSKSHQDGYVLDSWENITRKGVIPGNAGSSKIYQVMVTGEKEERMPPAPDAPLPVSQTDLVKQWINEGAENTADCKGCDTAVFTYSGAVAPIMSLNCTGCHNSNNAGGGINLTTYAGVQQIALNGKLMGTITWANGFKPMPQSGNKLSDCNITQINKWIIDGAKNN